MTKKMPCATEGCPRKARVKQLCGPCLDKAVQEGAVKHPTCLTLGCNRAATTQGRCRSCYSRGRRDGTITNVLGSRETFPRHCLVPGCENIAYARGMCKRHWLAGTKGGPRKIEKLLKPIDRPSQRPLPPHTGYGNVPLVVWLDRQREKLANGGPVRALKHDWEA